MQKFRKIFAVLCLCFIFISSVQSQPQLSVTATVTNVSCNGLNSGAISLNVTGGTGPYTYQWTNGSISNYITILNPVRDNSIYQSDVNNSNGASEYLVAGQTGFGYNTRALLAFDIAANLPAGAVITNASLKINQSLSSGSSGIQNMQLRKMNQNWGEGTSATGGQAGQGAPATPNDATWLNAFYPAVFWTVQGGVFSNTVSATSAVGAPGYYFWSSAGMVADLQFWLSNPASDFGWMLKGLETGPFQAKRFDSRENGFPSNHPALTINYNYLTVISTSQNLNGITTGSYTVVVSDANGNNTTTTANVNQASPLQLSFSSQPSNCYNTNGQATVNPAGGNSPYTFAWSNNQNTQSINGLSAGTYSCAVTDHSGCSVSGSTVVGQVTQTSPSTLFVNTCGSYFWNGVTYTTSGTYNYNTVNSVGCDSTATLVLNVTTCPVTLRLKIFLEGFYSNGSMTPVLYNRGLSSNPIDVDTIIADLHYSNPPYATHASGFAILHSNGEAEILFNAINTANNYFIAIRHKNSLETWSKFPVVISAITNFDFTTP